MRRVYKRGSLRQYELMCVMTNILHKLGVISSDVHHGVCVNMDDYRRAAKNLMRIGGIEIEE